MFLNYSKEGRENGGNQRWYWWWYKCKKNWGRQRSPQHIYMNKQPVARTELLQRGKCHCQQRLSLEARRYVHSTILIPYSVRTMNHVFTDFKFSTENNVIEAWGDLSKQKEHLRMSVLQTSCTVLYYLDQFSHLWPIGRNFDASQSKSDLGQAKTFTSCSITDRVHTSAVRSLHSNVLSKSRPIRAPRTSAARLRQAKAFCHASGSGRNAIWILKFSSGMVLDNLVREGKGMIFNCWRSWGAWGREVHLVQSACLQSWLELYCERSEQSSFIHHWSITEPDREPSVLGNSPNQD